MINDALHFKFDTGHLLNGNTILIIALLLIIVVALKIRK